MTSLRVYIIRRILLSIPMMLILLSVVFIVLRVAGDPVSAILGGHAPLEEIERIRRQLGLDKPLYIQYIDYLSNLMRLDLGRSMIWGQRPVLTEILEHFPATLELSISAFTFSVLLGVFTGVLSARRHNRLADRVIRLYGIITYSIFIPWFGLILQLIFGVYLGWLPISGRSDPGMAPQTITGLYVLDSILTMNLPSLIDSIRHLILPTITLGIYLSGIYTRLTRTHMIEVLQSDFIRAARARGLPERTVIYKHALKNAFIPILTMMGLQFALLLAGAVLTETTFSWPGMGYFLYERISYRDFTTIQGTIVFIAALIVLISLIVDIIYVYIDPRIRY